MSRISGVLTMLALAGALPLVAQQAPKADGQELAGTWTGLFKTEMGGGTARLVVERKSGYTAKFDFKPEGMEEGGGAGGGHGGGAGGHGPIELGPVTDFAVDGRRMTWSQKVMGNDCKAEAELEGASLKGAMDCGMLQMTFALIKG